MGETYAKAALGGILRYDGERFIRLNTEDGMPGNNVWDVCGGPDGTIWFAIWTGGVSQYDGNKFINFTMLDGLINNTVFCIHQDSHREMWFGMRRGGGASRYDGEEFANFTTKDGMSSNEVMSAYCDSDGYMWFATDSGGVCWCDGMTWTSLDARDGLAGNSVTEVYQTQDGSFWFATNKGVSRYRRNTTPPTKVYIASITTDQVYSDLHTIPPFTTRTRVTIQYNAIDYRTHPEKRQYRCRIREIDLDWRKPTKSDTFDFTFDKPGTYTFEVQAIDRDPNCSEPASVELRVIPDPRNHRIIQLETHIREQELVELEDARQIQQSLLPEKPPKTEGFEIAGVSNSAREVSGDFYIYLSLGDNTGIVLADVTGKSVKAAMVAAMTSGMLNEAISVRKELWNSPSMILSRLNAGLQPHLIRGMYTAMSLGIIQPEQKRLVFSNAGMPYPVVKRGDEVWELEVNGMPLGLVDKAEYQNLGFDMEAGDFVVFCSDGGIEAVDESEGIRATAGSDEGS